MAKKLCEKVIKTSSLLRDRERKRQVIMIQVQDVNKFLTFSAVREKGPILKNPSPIGSSGMAEYHIALHNMER